jgi:hypothetical protein
MFTLILNLFFIDIKYDCVSSQDTNIVLVVLYVTVKDSAGQNSRVLSARSVRGQFDLFGSWSFRLV